MKAKEKKNGRQRCSRFRLAGLNGRVPEAPSWFWMYRKYIPGPFHEGSRLVSTGRELNRKLAIGQSGGGEKKKN